MRWHLHHKETETRVFGEDELCRFKTYEYISHRHLRDQIKMKRMEIVLSLGEDYNQIQAYACE